MTDSEFASRLVVDATHRHLAQGRAATPVHTPTDPSIAHLTPAMVVKLQSQVGNIAASRLVHRLAVHGFGAGYMNIQRLRVANLASGTKPETLMRPHEGDVVLNVDTGHMTISDVLLANLQSKSWETLVQFMVVGHQFKQGTSEQDKPAVLLQQLRADRNAAAAKLKLFLKKNAGLEGAGKVFQMLDAQDQAAIQKVHNDLGPGFKVGDSAALKPQRESDRFDQVHIINALGFDPLNDPSQVENLEAAIRPGGELVVTAEATGESLASFFQGAPKELLRGTPGALQALIASEGPGRIKQLRIGRSFAFSRGMVDTKANVLEGNKYTKGLSTRHTVATATEVDMADKIPTVQLALVRVMGDGAAVTKD